MGDSDVETMANVTIAKYDFDDESFDDISLDAKDFITKLLIKDKRYVSFLVLRLILFFFKLIIYDSTHVRILLCTPNRHYTHYAS